MCESRLKAACGFPAGPDDPLLRGDLLGAVTAPGEQSQHPERSGHYFGNDARASATRCFARAMYWFSASKPTNRLPVRTAATAVEPAPMNGSRTTSSL